MRRRHRSWLVPSLAALPLALAAALTGSEAKAAGFQLKENSVQGLGRAYAGSAAAPNDCSVVVNNPAAIGELGDRSCLQGDLNIISFSTKLDGGGTDFLGRPLTGDVGDNGGVTKPVPAAYYTRRMNDAWSIGFSLGAPFGFETKYKDTWVGRYEGLLSSLESIDLTFASSFQVSDTFSLGANVFAQFTRAELTQAIDFGTILAGPTNGAILPQEADGFGGLKGDDWGFGFGLGALWKPTDSDRIGLNYHSEVKHTIEGDGTFKVPSNILPLLGGLFVDTGGKADFTTPWYINASWWHTVNDRFSFGVDIGYTNWSSFKELVVEYDNAQPDSVSEFHWKNTWFYSIGGDYRLNERWTVRAGLGYDKTPTHIGTRTPRVPDGNRTWLAFGVGYDYSDHMRFDAGYVHLFVDDADIDHDAVTFSTLQGTFESKGDILGISGTYRF